MARASESPFSLIFYYILTATGYFPHFTNGSLMPTEKAERWCDLSEATQQRQDSSLGFRTPTPAHLQVLGAGALSTKHISEAS